MERTLKRLMRVYPIARNWAVQSNYIAPLQSTQNISQAYSTDLTDHVSWENIKLPRSYASNDTRMGQDYMRILETAATDYTNMSTQDAVEMISLLFKSSKHFKDVKNIENHLGFVRLCEVINRDVRLLKISDIIESLKVFTYFRIPSNTLLTQSLLQMIRASINEISPRDIIFLTFLLKKMGSTPLRDALLIALPLVFEVQLPTKLDPEDIVVLIWSLRFTCEYNIKNPKLSDIIFESLWKFQENFDVQMAKSIFYSLCRTNYLPSVALQVLSNVQKVLTARASQLSVQDILLILEKLTFVTLKNRDHGYNFYNEDLINTLVDVTLASNIRFIDSINLLKLLNDIDYTHISLLDYIATKYIEESSLLKDISYFKISVFLEGLTNANYKPVVWDTIRDAILANKIENKSSSRSLIRFVINLIALDCYSPSLIGKVFSTDIKNNETMKNIYAREMLLLYQSIKTLYPMYDGLWPSREIIEYAATLQPASPIYSCRAALERALGGSQYVYNDLKTKLGHYIDHVVVMRKGGYPIAINTSGVNTTYVEDIRTPSESQMLLIFNLPNTAYNTNLKRLKSIWLLKIKSAEALTKSNAIVINSEFWMKLPEHERVPYLMQAVRLKCDDLSVSVN